MTTEELIQLANENFQRWNEALQTREPAKVADLYSEDNAFLPTLSPRFHQGTTDAVAYFEHFLAKNPFGTIVSEKVQKISEDSFLHSGMYDFVVGFDDDRQTVEARFTFVWQKINGEWKVIHHHSSLKPQA